MTLTNEIQEEAVHYPYSVVVRFRGEGKPYSFGAMDSNYLKDDWVVVETQQGMEMGQVQADCLDVDKYGLHVPTKPVIRKATEYDHRAFEENLEMEKDAFSICNKEIENLALDMHLLSAQYTLDRTKILFVYLAEQRVDFRELLKKLGARLHCRIELRQIGTRDKAKIIGGIGICGLPLCCSTFLNEFDGISINRAKNQMLSLNIPKLSGHCGKLICCLKYEDEAYSALKQDFPKIGTKVIYNNEQYRISSMNVLTRTLKLEKTDDVQFVSLDDVMKALKENKNAN